MSSRQRLRPSQIITTFGPGSIVDLPDDSVMLAGTDHWFDGHRKFKRIGEPRLQAVLKVSEFRTPPAGSYNDLDIPYVRFPRWRVCPHCNLLSNQFPEDRTNPESPPRCPACKVATYPARIVVACSKGHIDDFPWYRWVHRGQNCGGGTLFFKGEGKSAALGDLQVGCACGLSRSLSGALGRDAMVEARCSCLGRRPWLNDEREDCSEPLYALQRGASNIYFTILRSALSIPPWTNPLLLEVNQWWHMLHPDYRPPEPEWPMHIKTRFGPDKVQDVTECLKKILGINTGTTSIRQEEYDALLHSDVATSADLYFQTAERNLTARVKKYLSELIAVVRLREVRALTGFSRIEAPEMDPTMELFGDTSIIAVEAAPLSAKALDWLPAVENFGEGIFLCLEPERLKEWEQRAGVRRRAGILLRAYSAWRQNRGLPPLREQPPRLLLLHTLAHLLIRQVSLDCGYSSASLRERVYSAPSMAGVLIYTSTPDSDGSLGGLVRQTKPPEKFEDVLFAAVDLARVCSGDPLCREHEPHQTERLNGAACHACSMVAETSCEFGNRLLERRMVLSMPGDTEKTGYFDFDE
jgi:hypothetical protein